MLRTACSLVFVCALATAAPVCAQEQDSADLPAETGSHTIASGDLALAASAELRVVASSGSTPGQRRPAALIPLYASFATLQALDYASTTRALARGTGREVNPMMRSIVGNRAAFIAVKAGAAAGIIIAGEKMWKKNRVAAVIFVAAANGAVAAIVARNYSIR